VTELAAPAPPRLWRQLVSRPAGRCIWLRTPRASLPPLLRRLRPGTAGLAQAGQRILYLEVPDPATAAGRALSGVEVSDVMVPGYLAAMVRRVPPAGAPVVAGSTPVVSFGEPRGAVAATLGINPSAAEFTHQGEVLTGRRRRLATLESLQAQRCDLLTDSQVDQVIADCASYFARQPYLRWFHPLDVVLRGSLGVSYFDGSACHLDLVQWATRPVWGQIADPQVRQVLLDDGVPHLRAHLRHGTVRVVLLNGRTVVDQAGRAGLVSLSLVGTLPLPHMSCALHSGVADGVRYFGWSANLQGSHGVTAQFRASLAAWIATGDVALPSSCFRVKEISAVRDSDEAGAHDGFLPKGITVRGKQELAVLLGSWLGRSPAPTIGDVGNYGGKSWVWITLGGRRAHLNADTTRSAVRVHLDHVRSHGADADWHVVANRNGRINKVLFAPPGSDASGWYCYLSADYATPGRI